MKTLADHVYYVGAFSNNLTSFCVIMGMYTVFYLKQPCHILQSTSAATRQFYGKLYIGHVKDYIKEYKSQIFCQINARVFRFSVIIRRPF